MEYTLPAEVRQDIRWSNMRSFRTLDLYGILIDGDRAALYSWA